MTGIEKVLVSNFNGNTQSISLALADSALTTVGNSSSDSTATTTFTGVKQLVGAEMKNGGANLTVTYDSTVTAGTADSMNLAVAGQTAGTFTANGIETLNVTSSVLASDVTMAGDSLATINVSGDKAIDLNTLASTVTKLDASTATAAITATLSSSAVITVTGGAGNDSFTAGAELTASSGGVNAGAGTDTLTLTSDAQVSDTVEGGMYTNFETLAVRESGADVNGGRSQDVSLVAGITKIAVSAFADTTDDAQDGGATVAFTNLSSAVTALDISGISNASVDTDMDVIVTAARTTDTSADTLAITLGTTTASVGTDTASNGGGTIDETLAITVDNEETLSILSQGGANYVKTLTAADATSLTITGNKALTIASIASATGLATINASAATADVVISANASTTASTITGGTGNDTFVGSTKADSIDGGAGNDNLSGGALADTIIGGAGNDTIAGGAGADSLNGGDGNDTFNTTAAEFQAGVETVVGGAGTDTLAFTDAISVTAAELGAISGIEVLQLGLATGTYSMTLTDAVYTANGQAMTIDADALTSGTLTLTASALTAANAVTVDVDGGVNDGVAMTITTGAGNDKMIVEAADIDTVVFVAGSGTDTMQIGAGGTGAMSASSTGIENITFGSAAGTYVISTVDANVASGATMTVDASNLTTGTLNFSATETNGKFVITGGSGADTLGGGDGADTITGGVGADSITGGAGIDSLSGGDGNDIFVVAATGTGFTGLTSAEVVSGGAGNDTLEVAAGAITIAATDLVNISSIETVQILNTTQNAGITLTDAIYTANGNTVITIDADTMTSGQLTVAASGLSAANSINVDLDGTLTNGTAGTVTGGAGNDTLTLDAKDIDTVVFAAGAGTDTLALNTAGTGTFSTSSTGIEKVTFGTATGTYSVTTVNETVASGATMTIDASTLTTGTLTLVASSEADGKFIVTGGAGADTITAGSGADTIVAGSGADVITGGAGADSITGGVGADVFVYAAVAQSSGSTIDTITDFATTSDALRFTLDYSALTTAQTVDATFLSNSGSGYDGVTAAQAALSGNRGQTLLDVTNDVLYVNVNNDNLLTTLDYKVGIADLAGSSVVAGDLQYVISGGTADDTITGGAGNDTITGGAGADSITGGAGVDTIVFGASGAANGSDTLVGFTAGAGGDVMNFAAFALTAGAVDLNGGTTPAITAYTSASTADANIANKLALYSDATEANIDTATEIAALIEGVSDAFSLSGKAILITGDASGANDVARVWLINSALDGTVGDVTATDVVLVGTTSAAIDLDTLTVANFTF